VTVQCAAQQGRRGPVVLRGAMTSKALHSETKQARLCSVERSAMGLTKAKQASHRDAFLGSTLHSKAGSASKRIVMRNGERRRISKAKQAKRGFAVLAQVAQGKSKQATRGGANPCQAKQAKPGNVL
jgi:hypothetical protein